MKYDREWFPIVLCDSCQKEVPFEVTPDTEVEVKRLRREDSGDFFEFICYRLDDCPYDKTLG